ncbi:hypothetical protein Pint_36499 [Pistacia integerrima]|uniref:Uncharacterized protein n=1 Tax=Pistacia integerrima TaxID=434235 RepID=A0ACC0Y3X7_9ROSI|nr:hypothetical protein Pint_36499 [Pistacia integerrima]
MEQLLRMGFPNELAAEALAATGGKSTLKATEWILSRRPSAEQTISLPTKTRSFLCQTHQTRHCYCHCYCLCHPIGGICSPREACQDMCASSAPHRAHETSYASRGRRPHQPSPFRHPVGPLRNRFNKSQEDSFLPVIEDGSIVFIGATTENPSFHLITPLGVGKSAGVRFEVKEDAIEFLSSNCGGHARVALNALEISATRAATRVSVKQLKSVEEEEEMNLVSIYTEHQLHVFLLYSLLARQ